MKKSINGFNSTVGGPAYKGIKSLRNNLRMAYIRKALW
jgi:hypothetical protein